MSEIQHFTEPEQNLDITVMPGERVLLVVDLDDTMRHGGAVELPADLMNQMVSVWTAPQQRGVGDALHAIEDSLLGAAGILREGGDPDEARRRVWDVVVALRDTRTALAGQAREHVQ